LKIECRFAEKLSYSGSKKERRCTRMYSLLDLRYNQKRPDFSAMFLNPEPLTEDIKK
jgi:hypothetical protein